MRIAELFQKAANAVQRKIEALGMQLHKPLDCGGGFSCHDQAALLSASGFWGRVHRCWQAASS